MKTILALFALAVGLQATTVTSITCSGQTATVNATAHGLVASQGFELTGTSPQFNGTAVTVTTNSFTFTVPTGTACSTYTSGYTAVNAAIQLVQLPGVANPSNATVTEQVLGWFTTAYPNPLPCNLGANGTTCPVSAWPSANAAQNAAIVAGTTVEMYIPLTVAANTAATSVQSQLQTLYNNMQTGFAGYLLAQGYCYNGSAWVAAAAGSCH
jgi:hypothetical protein